MKEFIINFKSNAEVTAIMPSVICTLYSLLLQSYYVFPCQVRSSCALDSDGRSIFIMSTLSRYFHKSLQNAETIEDFPDTYFMLVVLGVVF
jgi:hypothetical protein